MTSAVRRRILFFIAGILLLYCGITVSSDLALKKMIDGGPCSLAALMSTQSEGDVCAVSAAVITGKQIHYGKGGSKYEITVRAPSSQSTAYIHLPADTASRHFFERLREGETIRLQRVAKKGYYMTGRVIAVADDAGANQTLDAPAMHLRMDVIQGIFGVILLVLAFSLHDKTVSSGGGKLKTKTTGRYTVTYRTKTEE